MYYEIQCNTNGMITMSDNSSNSDSGMMIMSDFYDFKMIVQIIIIFLVWRHDEI